MEVGSGGGERQSGMRVVRAEDEEEWERDGYLKYEGVREDRDHRMEAKLTGIYLKFSEEEVKDGFSRVYGYSLSRKTMVVQDIEGIYSRSLQEFKF